MGVSSTVVRAKEDGSAVSSSAHIFPEKIRAETNNMPKLIVLFDVVFLKIIAKYNNTWFRGKAPLFHKEYINEILVQSLYALAILSGILRPSNPIM